MPTTNTSQNDALERLRTGIAELTSSEAWLRWLDTARRFHQYSFSNQLLIALARPDSSHVAGFHAWRKLGRFVRRGEKGIAILAPLAKRDRIEQDDADDVIVKRVVGFKTVYVFDISQTDGEPLPEQPCHRLTGDDPARAFERLKSVAMSLGFSVVITDDLPTGVNGDCSHTNKRIRVRLSNAPAQKTKTLAHELAHALLHERCDNRALAECEAESVAYVICADLNLDSAEYSFGYIASWAGGGDGALAAITASGNCIQLAVKTILSTLEQQTAA